MKRLLLILVMMMTSALLSAQVIHVPGDQPTIQAGIDAATNGDVVLVDDGTYYENINFRGKAITVASLFWDDGDTNHINNTIIDGSQPINPDSASVVIFNSGEDTTSVLYGFSITGGSGGIYNSLWDFDFGAGSAFYDAGGRISHNKIFGNEIISDAFGSAGAGICGMVGMETPWVIIEHNEIFNNTSSCSDYSGFGGGMYIATNCKIQHNKFYNNVCLGTDGAHASGGGFEVEELPGYIIEYHISGNEVFNNTTDGTVVYGTGISLLLGKGTISNNYIYNNTGTAVDHCMGGGLRTLLATGKVTIDNNTISGNIMNGDLVQGGGIDVGASEGLVSLINNHIFDNELHGTTASWGSAINLVQDQDMIIMNNEIHDNLIAGGSWWCGAGIYCEKLYGSMEISGNNIMDNIGTGTSYGGAIGIYDTEEAFYDIHSNFIFRNQSNYGAGVWTYNTYNMSMINNIFTENNALSWGGAYALRQNVDDKPLNISIAHATGKAVVFNQKGSDLHPVVANNTFCDNAAGVGGAIHSDQNDQVPIFFNNIFWQNNAEMGDDIYYNGPDTIYLSHCDINTVSDTNVIGDWVGHGNIFQDPVFEPGDSLCHINGGACHDSGTAELEVEGVIYPAPDIDYEGTPRPQGDHWDIGADECLMESIWSNQNEDIFNLVVSPNPSSGAVNIQYSVYSIQYSKVEIYSTEGIKVKTLFSGQQHPGEHEMDIDLSDLPNGLYFIRLQAGEMVETTKVILIK